MELNKEFESLHVGRSQELPTCCLLCFYAAIKGASLGKVMPIALTSLLFGALMGIRCSDQALTPDTLIGTALTVAGIIILTLA